MLVTIFGQLYQRVTSVARNSSLSLWIIVIVTVVARLLFFIVFQPPLDWFDSAIYDATAVNFVNGLGFNYTPGLPDALREPGYSLFFLTPVYWLFGHQLWVGQFAQIGLAALVGVLLYRLGSTSWQAPVVGLVAGVLYAVHPGAIVYSGEILTEQFFTLVLVGYVYTIVQVSSTSSWSRIVWLGLIGGVLALTRIAALFLPWLVGSIIWLMKRQGQLAGRLLLAAVISMLVVAPWFIRNLVVFDSFIFGRTGGGDIYWTGSYIPWDGDWQGYVSPLTDIKTAAPSNNAIEQDRYMVQQTIELIQANPVGVAIIWLKKPLKIFGIPDGANYLIKNGLRTVVIPFFIGHWLVLLGVAFTVLRWRTYLKPVVIMLTCVVYFTILYLPLNAVTRYAAPLLPLLLLLGVAGWYRLGQEHYAK